MNEFKILSLILLCLIILDATGDGLRWNGKQILHHSVEIVREGIWLSLLVYFTGEYLIIPMYILARVALFDPIINLVAGKGINHVGSNSIYDIVLKWFTGKVKEPGHLIWVIRAIALIWWIVWFVINGG